MALKKRRLFWLEYNDVKVSGHKAEQGK